MFSSAPSFLTEMGHARRRPKRLAEKLRDIRESLGISQQEMAARLGHDVAARNVSRYERDKSEPTLKVLLAYARFAGVSVEQIVDDDQDLNAIAPEDSQGA